MRRHSKRKHYSHWALRRKFFSGELVTDNLETDLSGASSLEISGSATNYSVSASGASIIKNYELYVDFAHADLSGASNVYVTVNKEINVDVSGASHFYYKGGATIVNKDVSGGSSIINKN
jgi:ribosomal protein L31